MTTALIYHSDYQKHDTGAHPENRGRLAAIMSALQGDEALWSQLTHLSPELATEPDILRCHSMEHLDRVRLACEREVNLDPDTVVVQASLAAALRAAGGAISGVRSVLEKQVRNAFVAVRPPGHHARPAQAMGFCLFNNVAIAARFAQAQYGIERVLIIDWDVHHGNGTQDIFYDDPSVFFFSLHQSPWYPGTGRHDEKGSGRGEGTTLNLPLRAGTPAPAYRQLFQDHLSKICATFRPELILISAGFDSHRDDPLGSLMLEDTDFVELTKWVLEWGDRHAAGRVVACLEGGYNLQTLGATVRQHVRTLRSGS